METIYDLIEKVTNGCMADWQTRYNDEEKQKWLAENRISLDGEQREIFLQESIWNIVRGEWVLCPSAVAKMVRVSTQTIQKKCKNKKIKAYQNSTGHWYIPIDEVLVML